MILLFFKNLAKKRFYRTVIAKIDRTIWNQELSIITIKEIREGIRREFDKLESSIKASEEEVEKLLKMLEIPTELRKEFEEMKKVIPAEEMSGLNEETRDKVVKEAAEMTRTIRTGWLRDKSLKLRQGGDTKEEKEKLGKIVKQLSFLVELYEGFRSDAEKMQEQMMGKWSEKDQEYIGGFDQEVKAVESKIDGGMTYRMFVRKELKKL